MAFDAGTIIAHLEIEQRKADDDLRKFEARVRAFEKQGHKVRIGAEFDNPSIAKARRIFEQLDNQLSREAMQRLRSSPNGSVIGALNALFSPHQLAGAPTPQQSAQGGLLGRMAGSQGTAQAGTGSVLTQLVKPAGQSGTVNQNVREKLVGPAVGPDGTLTQKVQLKADNAGSQKAADDAAKTFSARFSEGLTRIFGGGAGKAAAGAIGGGTGGKGFLSGLLGGIGPGVLGLGAKITGGIGLGSALLGGLPALGAIGAGLGVLGIGAKSVQSQISPFTQQYQQAQNAIAMAQTPAQLKAANQQLAAANAGAKALGASYFAAYQAENQLSNTWQNIVQNIAPIFTKLLIGISNLLTNIAPQLNQVFSAAGPLITPLVNGISMLLKGLLPGLVALLKAALPAFQALAQVLGTLGKDLGAVFTAFAPVIKQSSVIFRALADVLFAILPIVAKLAAVMASALAPVFSLFAAVIKSLLPFLLIIGKILASLAKAVLGDLVSAFGALAQLLIAISPALNVFAKVLSSVFQTLENAGIFAILGNTLEAIVKPLGALISALLTGLAPILADVIGLISNLSATLVSRLAQALVAILPPLTILATAILKSIALILPVIIPLIEKFVGFFTTALGTTIAAIANALAAILNAIPPSVLTAIATAILVVVGALKLWAIAQTALDLILTANPIGLIIVAIGLLVVAVVELIKHWRTVWTEIKNVAEDVWRFIWNGFGKFLLPLLGPVGLIALGAIELAKHWKMVTGDIKSDAADLWRWLWADFGAKIFNFFVKTIPSWWDTSIQFLNRNFITPLKNDLVAVWHFLLQNVWDPLANLVTRTLPGWFGTAVNAVKIAWNAVKGVVEAPIKFVIDTVLDGLISAFDWISSKVGGPNIAPVHPFGLAGGGLIPGFGGGDRHPALLEGGEAVIDKYSTRQLAWLFRAMGVPGFAAGGLAAGGPPIAPPHSTKPTSSPFGILGKLGDVAKIIAAIVSGNSVALTNAFMGLFGHGTGGAIGDLAGLLTAIPVTLVKDAVHFLISTFTGGGPGGGVATSAQVVRWITEAIGITGVPLTWLGLLEKLVSFESGGNPRAANTTPAGIAAGYPEGIAQVTIGTFAADHLPGLDNIWAPVDNLVAGIRHILMAWGSIFNIPGLGAPGKYGGYKHGGRLEEPVFGWGPSGNRYMLHAGETVVPGLGGRTSDVIDVLSDIADSLDQLIVEVRAGSTRTGAAIGASLGRAARSAGNSALYQ